MVDSNVFFGGYSIVGVSCRLGFAAKFSFENFQQLVESPIGSLRKPHVP